MKTAANTSEYETTTKPIKSEINICKIIQNFLLILFIFRVFLVVSDNLTNIIDRQLLFGFPLNHSLYYDFSRLCPFNGSVTQIRFRLFNHWQGDHPLYIFIIQSFIIQSSAISYSQAQIIHRYPIIPKKNNTQWQIFNIPKGLLPIKDRYNVGIGMQDHISHTNKIYAIQNTAGILSNNITNATIRIDRTWIANLTSIAFIYTATKDNIN